MYIYRKKEEREAHAREAKRSARSPGSIGSNKVTPMKPEGLGLLQSPHSDPFHMHASKSLRGDIEHTITHPFEHDEEDDDKKEPCCNMRVIGTAIFVIGSLFTFAAFTFGAQSLLARHARRQAGVALLDEGELGHGPVQQNHAAHLTPHA